MVAKDNTVAIGDRVWQIEESRIRGTPAGCTVTIHEHLDGRVSLRFGPHVVGRFDSQSRPLARANPKERRGKDGGTAPATPGPVTKRKQKAAHAA